MGEGGIDEMTTTGVTYVAELKDGAVSTFEVTPEEAGLERATLDDLKGGDAQQNAAAMRAMLGGERSPFRDVVLYTSAGVLIVAGKVQDLKEGVGLAREAVDSGRASATLDRLIEITNRAVAS